jgi:hypothetical protein
MSTGGCFCGAVRYEATHPLRDVTYCHCSKCRKWHGTAGAYTAVPHEHFRLTEQRGLKWHTVSPTVRRGFCGECGSTVLFDEKGDPMMGITAGTVDDPTGMKSKAHIFLGSKGDWYEVPHDGLLRFVDGSQGPKAD